MAYVQSGPKVIKLFSCSTQLSMKFFLLINVKMPTIVGILTLMSGKNSILDLSEPKKAEFLDIFLFRCIYNFMLNWVEHENKIITSGPDCRVHWFILTSLTSRDSMLLLECKLNWHYARYWWQKKTMQARKPFNVCNQMQFKLFFFFFWYIREVGR